MKTGVVLALVALAACASVGTAIRLDGQLFSFGSAMPQVLQREDEKTAVILIEYAVPPPRQPEFVELFQKLTDETKKEPGVKVWALSRTVDENLTYYLYSEFTKESAGKHQKSEYFKEFIEGIYKLSVVYKIHILDQIIQVTPQ